MFAVLAAVVVSISAVNLYLAPFVPIVTAAVVKITAPGWVKTGVTALTATVVTLVTTAVAQSTDLVLTWDTLWRSAMAIGIAVASYLVFRKPVVDPIADKVPGGIG